mgnify:CR=1 FL=1
MLLAAAVGALPPVAARCAAADGVSTSRYARSPSRRERSGAPCIRRLCPLTAPAAPASQLAASAGGKSLRARGGVPLRPPCALASPSWAAVVGGRGARQAPAVPFFWSGGGWLLAPPSAAVAALAGLAAGSSGRGGLLQAAKRPPASRPAAPAPPPVFRRGRGALVCAAAGIDVVAGMRPGHYMWCFIQWK